MHFLGNQVGFSTNPPKSGQLFAGGQQLPRKEARFSVRFARFGGCEALTLSPSAEAGGRLYSSSTRPKRLLAETWGGLVAFFWALVPGETKGLVA